MKNVRMLFCLTVLLATGCATSLAPGDNFNDWSNSAAYHHYQQKPQATYAATAPHVDDDGAAGE